MDRYGVDHHMKLNEFREKRKQTCIERYGVDNSMKSKELFTKWLLSSYQTKMYEFPSGHVQPTQGNEHFCLDDLLFNYEIDEDDLINGYKNMPNISYIFDHERHHYHPDIFIPSKNLLIEVKSDYTFKLNREINIKKLEACIDLGYDIQIWIYDKKGKLIDKKESFD